jgi:hypothetical protein
MENPSTGLATFRPRNGMKFKPKQFTRAQT